MIGMHGKKAQGSLEYLIILVAALVVAAVVVMFLTSSAGGAGGNVALCKEAAASCANKRLLVPDDACSPCEAACSTTAKKDLMTGAPVTPGFNEVGSAVYWCKRGMASGIYEETTKTCEDTCTFCDSQAACLASSASCQWCGGYCDTSCSVTPPPSTCSDGTEYDSCSSTKPKKCVSGTLINVCSECGCPGGYTCESDGKCTAPALTCSDGTAYGACSSTYPKFCEGGTLVDKCSACSCPFDTACLADETCNSIPVVTFTSLCYSQAAKYCNFTATATDSDGTVVSYKWDFGDGQTQTTTETSVTHTYATQGARVVNVDAFDDDGTKGTKGLWVLPLYCGEAPVQSECAAGPDCIWAPKYAPFKKSYLDLGGSAVVAFGGVTYIGYNDGHVTELTSTGNTTLDMGASPVTRLFTNTTHLFIGIPGDKQLKIYDWGSGMAGMPTTFISSMTSVKDFYVYGGKLYVLGTSGGTSKLEVYKLSDLTTPEKTQNLGAGATLFGINVNDDYYYVAMVGGSIGPTSGLRVYAARNLPAESVIFPAVNAHDYIDRVLPVVSAAAISDVQSDQYFIYIAIPANQAVYVYNRTRSSLLQDDILDISSYGTTPSKLAVYTYGLSPAVVIGTTTYRAHILYKDFMVDLWGGVQNLQSKQIDSVSSMFIDGTDLYVGAATGGLWSKGAVNVYSLASGNGCS